VENLLRIVDGTMAPNTSTSGAPPVGPAASPRLHREVALSAELAAASRCDPAAALQRLDGSEAGVDAAGAAARLNRFGPNRIAQERQPGIIRELAGRARNPLNSLLLTLAVVSYVLGDVRAAAVIAAMVVLSILTALSTHAA
jgi:P-type Mg2+ transporter